MELQIHSQNISTQRVQALINERGDTVIELKLMDAKIVLEDIIENQILDSLVAVYKNRDQINTSMLVLKDSQIKDLETACNNDKLMLGDLDEVIIDNKKEIADLNVTIKKEKKEIIKQKILKTIGFTAAIVFPITVLILTSH